eukprot:PhM_4_TR18043/c3_g1_i3/m.97297
MHQGAKSAVVELLQWSQSQDIIALQELGSGLDVIRRLPDFFIFHTGATGGRSTALLVRKSIVNSGMQLELNPPEDTTATAVQLELAHTRFVIVNIYVSPTVRKTALSKFLASIAIHLPDVILGDFNARHELWCPASKQDSDRMTYRHDAAQNRGLEVLEFIKGGEWKMVLPDFLTPTHFSSARPTTPDVILLRSNHQAHEVEIMRTPSSDHAQLMFQLKHIVTSRKPHGGPRISWRKVNAYHKERFQMRLDSLLRRYDSTATLDQRVWSLVAAIRTAEKSLPRGKLTKCIPAWSARLAALRQDVLALKQRNAPQANQVETEYREAATAEYERWCRVSPRNFWTEEKEDLPPSTIRLPGGQEITTPGQRCTLFAEYFASKHKNQVEIEPYTPVRGNVTRISPFELRSAIYAHPLRKSCDPDGLTAEHLRLLTPHAETILVDILSDSLQEGRVPSAWKTSRVRPSRKPGRPPDAIDSYRPVAITSILSRTIERVILRRVEPHLQQHIHRRQFGFRRAYSCEQLLRT